MRVLLVLGCVVAAVSAQNASAPCTDTCYGDYVPDPTSCCFYYQCVGPNQYRMPCPEGLHFNSVLKVCDWSWRANCTLGGGGGGGEGGGGREGGGGGGVVTPGPGGITPPCTSLNPETLPYENDCSKYYYCFEGYPNIVQCDPGYGYDAANHSCTLNSNCSEGGVVTPGPGGVVSPCKSTQPATLPFENNCTLYYYCYEGYPFIVECDQGKYFSAADHECINATECPSGGGGTGGNGTGGGVIAPCSSMEPATLPYQNNCSLYYYCYEGYPYLAQCDQGKYFSEADHKCINATECPSGGGGTGGGGTGGGGTGGGGTGGGGTGGGGTGGNGTGGGIIAPCTSTEPATLAYPNNCSMYYYCYKGFPYTAECDQGKYFSAADHACIKATECPSGGGGTGGGTGGGSGGSGGGVIDFKCPDQYGTYPYPNDTTRYYYCYNNTAYIVQCNQNQYYDSSVNACNPS